VGVVVGLVVLVGLERRPWRREDRGGGVVGLVGVHPHKHRQSRMAGVLLGVLLVLLVELVVLVVGTVVVAVVDASFVIFRALCVV